MAEYKKIIRILDEDVKFKVVSTIGDNQVKLHIKAVLNSKIIAKNDFVCSLQDIQNEIKKEEDKIITLCIKYINATAFPSHVKGQIIASGYAIS